MWTRIDSPNQTGDSNLCAIGVWERLNADGYLWMVGGHG